MKERLFINEHEIDLKQDEKIGYTKQVNSLKDIAKRDSNFTKSFKVPKTAKNVAYFKGLGIVGSTSPMPYQKNTARLFLGNICIIFKGWTLFESTLEKDYEIYIYDGHIDFMKQLDNKTFDDVDLPEIEHIKEVPVIKDNWNNGNEYYKYLLADFNGETHFDNGGTNYINADYLIPAVPVKYLWERIFETFGFTFSGSIFTDEEYLNLFLTYPKGVIAGEVGGDAFSLEFAEQPITYYYYNYWCIFRPDLFDITFAFPEGEIVDNPEDPRVKSWKCPKDGYYQITLTGSMTNNNRYPSYFYLGKNQWNVHPRDLQEDSLVELTDGQPLAVAHRETVSIEFDKPVQLFAGETLSIFYFKTMGGDSGMYYDNTTLSLNMQVTEVDQTLIDQVEFFKNLTPKDFYKEVLWRFGLTPFPSKTENHIEFLTYDERINGETLDWSDKFVRQVSEKYVLDKYAKSNYFRFLYNGEGDDFNDGVIKIQNENLEEKIDIINSKTYSPEKLPVPFDVGGTLEEIPKLELWEKEPTEEDGQVIIQYNPRDARFSFVRERIIERAANLGSKQLMVYDSVNQVRAVEHYNYSWQNIIEGRYKPVRSLFNKTNVKVVEFHMTPAEFDAFDMKPTIYVEQMGGEFLVDNLSKPDLTKNLTKAELIKINR